MATKLAKCFSMALIILLMSTALAVFFAPRFQWRVDTVSSGSMEPALMVGSVVITRPIEAESIRVGDIITFHSPLKNELTSHRVVATEKDSNLLFRTKGDANEDIDPYKLPAADIVGKVCFYLPYFGYVAQFIKTPPGIMLTLCLPGLIIIFTEMRKIWRVLSEREMERKYHIH